VPKQSHDRGIKDFTLKSAARPKNRQLERALFTMYLQTVGRQSADGSATG
jgi:hypothetical protein